MDISWKEKRVLITGANGFVGGWLASELRSLGARVVALARDGLQGGLSLHGVENIAVVHGDVTDKALVERVLAKYEIDTCFHLAAQSLVHVAACCPVATFESNIRGTWTLLEQCRVLGAVRRIVVMTSDKVYGAQANPEATEADPLLGLHPYDASKVCADVIARSYATAFGLPVAVARCANIYGGGDLNYSRIVPYAVRCVLLGEPIRLRGDGASRREFLFVQDAVAALLALATNLDRGEIRGRAFNFGSNEAITVLSLVRQIAASAARPDHEIVPAPSPAPGELVCQRLDSSLAKRLLSWRAEVDLTAGLQRTVDWYRTFYGAPGHGHRC